LGPSKSQQNLSLDNCGRAQHFEVNDFLCENEINHKQVHVKKISIKKEEFRGFELVCKLDDARKILNEIYKQHILRDQYSHFDTFLKTCANIVKFLRCQLKNA
jgi:hypothetical protein